MKKLVSAMKVTKDKMESPLSLTQVNQYLDAYKSAGADRVDVATVMGHPNFQSYTKLWMDACHAKGLLVTLRSASREMEGLYGTPKAVGGARLPTQFYIDQAMNELKTLLWQSGDEVAIFPERTEGVFADASSWISPTGLPGSYADFFIALHNALKTVLPAGVIFGMSGNNASELLSGWMPASLINYAGMAVIDHYVDGNPTQYEADLRAIKNKYGKPIYVQEGAPHRFQAPTRAEADAYYAVNKKLADEGILGGYGAWGGWAGNPESIIHSDFTLNDNGKSLQAWFAGMPTPTPIPTPIPPPSTNCDLEKIAADLIAELQSQKKLTAIRTEIYSSHSSITKVNEVKKIL